MNFIGQMFFGGLACGVFLLGWDVNILKVGLLQSISTWILGCTLILCTIVE